MELHRLEPPRHRHFRNKLCPFQKISRQLGSRVHPDMEALKRVSFQLGYERGWIFEEKKSWGFYARTLSDDLSEWRSPVPRLAWLRYPGGRLPRPRDQTCRYRKVIHSKAINNAWAQDPHLHGHRQWELDLSRMRGLRYQTFWQKSEWFSKGTAQELLWSSLKVCHLSKIQFQSAGRLHKFINRRHCQALGHKKYRCAPG